jgi:Fe2+ transport system protein FeoA
MMTKPREKIVLLNQVPAGASATVRCLAGGHGMLSRLAALGFTPGVSLTMVQNYGHGPLIVAIRGARIALGRGEASRIEVQLQDDGVKIHESDMGAQ